MTKSRLLRALWALIQSDLYANQRVIVETLHANNALRADLDVTRATDILWTLDHPGVWLLLVGKRGWTPEQFEQWCGDTTCTQLLKSNSRADSGKTLRGRRAAPGPG